MNSEKALKIIALLMSSGLMLCVIAGAANSPGVLLFGSVVFGLGWLGLALIPLLVWRDVEKNREDMGKIAADLKAVREQLRAVQMARATAPAAPRRAPEPTGRRVYEIEA